jgi:MscS family membrane protein
MGGIVAITELIAYRHLLPRAIKKNLIWTQSFLFAIHHPLQTYIWTIVVSFIISSASKLFAFDDGFVTDLMSFRHLITVLFIFWFGMRFIRHFENAVVHRTQAGLSKINDRTSVHAIAQLARIALIIIILLMLLQTAGVKMSALLTLGGVSGAIIGFAAKDSLANFIGGMMIYWDRPFSVGDWIRSPDREIEGTVENIGWRLTRIRTLETRPLYVANGVLSNISIENLSRMLDRRIKVSLSVRYNDANKIVAITQDVKAMLVERADIDTTQMLFVNLTQLDTSSLTILIYAFTKATNLVQYQVVLQEILLKVLAIVAAHGAECAFPTQTIDIPEDVLTTLKERVML